MAAAIFSVTISKENAKYDQQGSGSSSQHKETQQKDTALIGTGWEVRSIHGWRWALAVSAILCSTFLFALDTTVVANIQPSIVETYGEINKLPWLAAAFVLPGASLQLPWSRAYLLANIKWLYIAHVVLFEVGSAIAGAAPTWTPSSLKERPLYISLITPVWGLGTVLGPIVGGAFADSSATWRWGFYINLIIFAVSAPIMVFLLPSIDLAQGLPAGARARRFDWLGVIVFSGWCVSFAMAINFGGTVYSWQSADEIVLWVFAGVLIIAFVLTQKFHRFIAAENRLYPTKLLRNWRYIILQYCVFAAAGVTYIPIFNIPLFFQFTQGDSSLDAAVRLLPFVFMVVFFSLASGVFMSRVGYISPWFFFGSVLGLVGSILLYTVTPETSQARIYGYSVLVGIGGGCYLMSAFGAAPAVVEQNEVLDATGALSLAQGLGLVFFTSLFGSIFQNLGMRYIEPLVPPELLQEARDLLAGSKSDLFSSLSPEVREQVIAAIISALGKAYLASVAAAGVSLILSPFLGLKKIPLGTVVVG
ncbi:mfs drug efflux transporter [Achaetomium macrosporum]|uniref:Mfs drug efflux transporter n=1 Tax=Achaetomium macrosporum TaxID=79813 RepID=A0AAN7C7R5_9PEZI|nr:mfs drug efflux transporter [Achaetomium macrosporum]